MKKFSVVDYTKKGKNYGKKNKKIYRTATIKKKYGVVHYKKFQQGKVKTTLP